MHGYARDNGVLTATNGQNSCKSRRKSRGENSVTCFSPPFYLSGSESPFIDVRDPESGLEVKTPPPVFLHLPTCQVHSLRTT
ncbi:hypothetical protein J6590_086135 [Homalodisca vitripennis]|nr:hypothetical protein J6590_070536 [Homalodisca vitripennis]KAG8290275.1 hypothetical protein J6590_086135 [Homalodisca vitripennis]